MPGWQFGGWPPPPPSDGAFVTFDAVKAALALADTPISLNGQALTDFVLPLAPTFPPIRNSGGGIPLLAGADLDIAGPAAGFIRIINNVLATVTGANATLQTALLSPALPGTQVIQRGLSVTSALSVAVSTSTQPYGLGPGETFRITNTGANPCTIYYDYYDIPDTGITLFRLLLSTVPVVVIPAAPAGSYRRCKVVAKISGGITNSAVVNTALAIFAQDDTGSLTLQTFYNGLQVAQVATVPTPSASAGALSAFTVTAHDFTAVLVANAAARPPMIWGAYETVVGTP